MKVTPDIYGLWALHGTTLAPDGSTLYEWDADMEIFRRDGSPAVIISTKGGASGGRNSRSLSFAEKFERQADGNWRLRYGYEADPEHEATASHEFFGLSQLTFSTELSRAEGSSCNYNGRYVIMRLQAERL
ncbi:Cap15 family cyclic dinucleotide receptor domain-containing protein [Rhizorhabdus sp. FW153]|uniref:Cap15 family cyclic dinucleotide receptor domain-containing protein n=1 Tax=Rhizorhabdus sp. FW153 TaxID=3400216 RepID=UPI003CEFD66E